MLIALAQRSWQSHALTGKSLLKMFKLSSHKVDILLV